MSMKIHIILSFSIIWLLLMMMISMKKKFFMNFSQMSSVECGFNSLLMKKFKFSNQFFMIAIIFVIFDMELIILMPIPTISGNTMHLIMLFSIVNLLSFSLLMEWMNGIIQWVKS